MIPKFYCYPKCTTCGKAKKFLEAKGIVYEEIHIKDSPPTASQLKEYHEYSNLPLKRLFNTSGDSYRKNQLKDKFDSLTLEDAYNLLANDGLLIKRPILVLDKDALFGFNEAKWKEKLDN